MTLDEAFAAVSQEALTKAGFTEDVIAENIIDGIAAERTFLVYEGEESRLETALDYDALDLPNKSDATVTNLVGYDELEQPQATSPGAAQELVTMEWELK